MQMQAARVRAEGFVARRRLWLCAIALGLGMTGALSTAQVRAQGLPDFTELVEKVGPAVVNIRTTERCLLYTSPSPRDGLLSRMPSSA